MKKVLLLSLGLVMGLGAFAQQAVVKSLPAPVKASIEKKALGTDVVEGTVNFVTRGTQSVVTNEGAAYLEAETMYTTCDLQSNSFIANRMYQLKDGSVAVSATMSLEEFDESFPDRGTGYNFAKGGMMDSWGDVPGARIEDLRTGWPSIAPYGAEGEILVSHGHENGLCYYIREKAGEGEWDGPHAIPSPTKAEFTDLEEDLQLSWPRIATTGENNDVVHILAAGQGDVNVAHFYVRSTDLENWEVKYAPVQEQGLHLFKIGEAYSSYAGDDYALSTNGDRIAVVYCSGWSTNVYCYESSDAGLTWESRLVWESPIHGLDWTTDEASLVSKCYGPVHAAVAIGQDGVSHVALSVGLFEHATLEESYGIYSGMMTDGIAYWNDTTAYGFVIEGNDTIYNTTPNQLLSPQDDSLKHALRLWWDDVENPGYIVMDLTNFCAWMPPHVEEGFGAFDMTYQYTGSVAGSGQAGDYATKFGLSAYPALAVDPAGNLAITWSSPDLNRELYAGLYYMRTIFAKYKPADVPYWFQVNNHGTTLYEDFVHMGDEATNITGVSVSVNENEFWFSCLSDDTPGFHSGNNTSQPNISNGIINVFKYTPLGSTEAIGENEAIDVVYNIFPNPASEFINISSSMDANATVTFTNIAGQTVKVVNHNLTTGDNTIAINDLTSGVYFCTVTANGYSHTSKVVVK
jgi:hypothetical protein